ncbi:SMP-30/gluconolactonase/LRE family protein [Candidatus Poribacteria bacterium]|nr:SMP-30/gluconolactonase/LRE family protein [Candidatus Poribacteria bacterium]
MNEKLFTSKSFTEPGGFTSGIEGPACDAEGNLYAVNYARQHTIGKVTPEGECSIFVELPNGSIGNGIRFNRAGFMLIADYTNHNILKVDMNTREISVYAHEPTMNQPNDIAIGANDIVYASDPNWAKSTGQIWRIDTDGAVTLLEPNMGTTNGIEVSPDEKTLYVNESVQRNIWAYDLSEKGEISNKRLLIQFPDFGMDGMRCDVAGNLYVTRHGKGTVAKVSPQGEVLLEVQLTGKQCTNVAFGGPDGRTCYVTVADKGNIECFRTNLPGRSWQLFHRN